MNQEEIVNKEYTGRVVYWKNGFGFIRWEKDGVEQPDIFVHYTGLVSSDEHKRLFIDDVVSFRVGESTLRDNRGDVALDVKLMQGGRSTYAERV